MSAKIKTTGQMRVALADAIEKVLDGSMELQKADALHRLSKNISMSLAAETRLAMFRNHAGVEIGRFGSLPLGDPGDK